MWIDNFSFFCTSILINTNYNFHTNYTEQTKVKLKLHNGGHRLKKEKLNKNVLDVSGIV